VFLVGFHNPALESLTPQLAVADDLSAVSALTSLRDTTAAIAGPTLAGARYPLFERTRVRPRRKSHQATHLHPETHTLLIPGCAEIDGDRLLVLPITAP
jgi:hypothetical protein